MVLRLPSLQVRVCANCALPCAELCGPVDNPLPTLVQCLVCLMVLVVILLFVLFGSSFECCVSTWPVDLVPRAVLGTAVRILGWEGPGLPVLSNLAGAFPDSGFGGLEE